MKFEIITVDEYNKDHGTTWSNPMSNYKGEVRGFFMGVNPEVRLKDSTLDCESATFIREIEELNDEFWTEHRADMSYKYEWTGRLVFRGYYEEYYDYEERDEYYIEQEVN